MKRTSYVIASAVLSLVLHGAVLGTADRFRFEFEGVDLDVLTPAPAYKPLKIRSVDPRELVMETPEQTETRTVDQVRDEIRAAEAVKDVFADHKLVERARPRLELTNLGRDLLAHKTEPPAAPRAATAPRPEIIEIDASALAPDRLVLHKELQPKLARRNLAKKIIPSLVAHAELAPAVGSTFNVGMKLSLPPTDPLRLGALGSSGETGEDAAVQAGRLTAFKQIAPPPGLPGSTQSGLSGRREGMVNPLDALLTVTMQVFPEADGGGFFRIDIRPNPQSERLRAIPKDILYLIDCSNSISAAKLEQFKAGVAEAVEYLTSYDRFNVVSFRDRPEIPFSGFLEVTPTTVDQARRYVRSITRGGMTDVFAGLAPFVGSDTGAAQRPLNVFLMSDGKTTVKNSPRNEELIREIVKLNRANVSIYSFSAGRSANLFLLDFLAYHNRGRSLHKAELRDFKRQLIRFMSTHTSLIVADLEYHITGGLAGEIFPKRLPHLYRDGTLAIYGRFPADTKEIALSVVGRDAAGELEELIFRGNLADCPQAPSRLPLDWAAQKIFHLIGLRTLQPSQEIDEQVRQLADQYNMYVPY